MKNKYDELVNRYIDNELNINEIEEVESLVNSNNKFKTYLAVHKFVHETLYKIPLKPAPAGTTELIMSRIVSRLSDKYKKSYFFRVVLTILNLVIITILFLLFFYINNSEMETTNVANTVTQYFGPAIKKIYNVISSDIFRTISGLAGFIILLGFYFYYNSFKQLKEKLKQL